MAKISSASLSIPEVQNKVLGTRNAAKKEIILLPEILKNSLPNSKRPIKDKRQNINAWTK
jgi:hypothetical protein